ncbi:hypothetical protein GT037_001443 [Alternaria burnsii]|uniref:ATPase AAA-type core domain-containing protein n=1 Tax=Alternaria burnsii TaxID=1187904 RepID=A0A8H7BDF1_9PLEO|nr:uncharacterized protein GT037_001443 [Alternaria burnsii]KAF7679792.1 hypothetical protein GT037_001443 [Alternaria burnsii]
MVPEVKEAMQSEPSKKFQTMAFGYVLSEKKEKEKSNVEEPSFRGPRLLSNADTGASSSYGPRASRYATSAPYPHPPPLPRPVRRHRRTRSLYDPEDSPDDEDTSGSRSFYKKEDMTDILKVMLSGKVYGFSLGDSTWGTFSVSRVGKPDWNLNVWGQLVMNARQKELLESLTLSHGREQSGFDDIIKGKGKGLVGLLLGPPGLPLYVMSCGGLESYAHEINSLLKTYLELASRRNAVLLLDEADVYLAKRNDNDLERNAIISVFPREIEYYTGILILTTNRAQSIDPAFQSRIHFCHHYHRHNTSTRKKIWKTFVEDSRKNPSIHIDISEDGFDELAALNLNGREIKNTMSLAVSLTASKPGDNLLQAERIIDITKLLQNFNFVDEDEPEDKEEEYRNDETLLNLQIDLPCQGVTENIPKKVRDRRPRKIGIPKIQIRNRSTESSNTGIANSV